MAKTRIPAPATVPRLVPSLVGEDPAVLARESTSHADAILRLTNQSAAAQDAAATVQTQADATNVTVTALAATVAAIPTSGRLLRAPQLLTGSGTFIPATGTTRVIFWLQAAGGGGGGGGAGANFSAGAGGGAGACLLVACSLIPADLVGIAYTGGPGGGGGVGNASGSAGTDAVITVGGSTYTAKAATGGTGMANTAGPADAPPGAPAPGSTATAAVLATIGARGERGFVAGAGQFPGNGASSPFGIGGLYASGGAATAGSGFGSGGGGGANGASNGAAGAATCILIEEYS